MAARKAFAASAAALRASLAGSLFNRAAVLWIQQMLKNYELPPEGKSDMQKLLAATSFVADASVDATQQSARATAAAMEVRRSIWL